jgi:hypothetical protein
MKHFVNLSGGAGSWYTARRVIESHTNPGDEVHLVFADTNMEDEDLYRFLAQCVSDLKNLGEWYDVGVTYTRLADGRDVWQVFNDVRFLGNSRIDPCSKILKRDLIRKHLEENFDPADTICYIGIDWSEEHRYKKAVPYWQPFIVKAPLTEPPYVDKAAILSHMTGLGINPPRLYGMGFPHNNCGGFCVKAGQGAFKLLLEKMPERYAYHEAKEQELRDRLGKDVAILTDRRGGERKPLTLLQLRKRVEGNEEVDELDLGGCACFTPDSPDEN